MMSMPRPPPVDQQEAHVFEDVGGHVAGGGDARRQHRLAHQGGDRQQQQAAAEQYPGGGVALEDVATHGQGDQGADQEFHHKTFPRVEVRGWPARAHQRVALDYPVSANKTLRILPTKEYFTIHSMAACDLDCKSPPEPG